MMVTSETEGERVETALSAGADEYLMKPFTREILAEKLAVLGF
jgi:two-component system chemotaxis response regulator CheY